MIVTCAEYRRWLSPYVDAMLEPERRAELDIHLRDCGSCRQELVSLQGMLQTLRTLEPPTSPDLVPGIRRRLDAASWWRRLASRFTAPWPVSLPLHGLALATTALLVVVAANLPGVARRDQIAQDRLLGVANGKPQDADFRREGDRLVAMAPADEKQAVIFKEEAPARRKQGEYALRAFASDNAVPQKDNERPLVTEALSDTGTERAALDAQDALELPLAESTIALSESSAPSVIALEPIQAQWRVADFAAAASQASEWVSARQGWAAATNEHHLSIKLPASAVPEFLEQFTTDPPAAPDPTQPLWLTISLELVASP